VATKRRSKTDGPASPGEIRCAGCGSLLAKLAGGTLHLQRGDLQASFDGDFHASIVCYRAKCRRLNVVRVAGDAEPSPGSERPV
jgi:hypothetical protein